MPPFAPASLDSDPGGLVALGMRRRPLVVAHRGASASAPENTLIAYRHALMLGAEAAECDVQLSADGEVVLMHDRSLSRTTDGRGLVSRRSWAQLSRLDAGAWKGEGFAGEPVARLSELVDLARGRMRLFVELKAGRGLSARVAEVLEARGARPDEVVLMSFDTKLLAEAQALAPRFARVLLRRKPLFGASYGASVVDQALTVGAHALGLNQKGVSSEVCGHARDAGLPVLCYTVNDPWRARTLRHMGVDGIISDVPRRIEASLGTVRKRRRRLAA